jgi:hypothetical protein
MTPQRLRRRVGLHAFGEYLTTGCIPNGILRFDALQYLCIAGASVSLVGCDDSVNDGGV